MSQTERSLSESIDSLVAELDQVKSDMANLAAKAANDPSFDIGHSEPFIITGLTVFVLACFGGLPLRFTRPSWALRTLFLL